MKRLKLPKSMPIQIRELITMDFTRANPCPPPGVHVRELTPRELAALTPQELAEAGLSPPSSPPTEPRTSNPQPASKETGATDRTSNGCFAKGNRGGPGNPFARQVAAFRACLINAVTEDDFKAVVFKLVERARNGNLQAIKLLFSYLLGTPKPVVEPDELDLMELHLAHQEALATEALQEARPDRPVADDATPLSDGEVGRPAASEAEAPPSPPASAPSTNHTNGETCPLTTGQAPSTNRVSDVSEADKPAALPSPNRPNGEPAAGGSKNCPSTIGPNGTREPDPVCGGLPGGQAAETDEKRT